MPRNHLAVRIRFGRRRTDPKPLLAVHIYREVADFPNSCSEPNPSSRMLIPQSFETGRGGRLAQYLDPMIRDEWETAFCIRDM